MLFHFTLTPCLLNLHLEQLPVVMAGRATVVDQSSAAEDEPHIVVLGGHDRPPRATLPQPFLKPNYGQSS